ncbi:hypothetical protein V6Z12_D05G233900 [Gossypium hirsutum]
MDQSIQKNTVRTGCRFYLAFKSCKYHSRVC